MGFDSPQSTATEAGSIVGFCPEVWGDDPGSVKDTNRHENPTRVGGGVNRRQITMNKEGGNDLTKQKWYQFNYQT
jgi:hypothetical protein